MRRFFSTITCLALTALAVLCCNAGTAKAASAPVGEVDPPYIYSAEAAIVVDGDGRLLWGYNQDSSLALASITKVMTAVCALDSGADLDAEHGLVATPDIWYSQLAKLEDGDRMTLRDLLRVLLVYSANDCAINIGIIVAGSESAFVERMNQKAQELGLANSHFMNPHGLEEEGHYASASDLVKLGRYALENYPFIAETVVMEEAKVRINGEERSFATTDMLLSTYPGACGIKTGSVGAGDSFLGAFNDGSIELYTCVLCCPTSQGRWDDTRSLMDWARDRYTQIDVGKDDRIISVRPFACNYLFNCAISADGDTRIAYLPGDGAIDYSITMPTKGLSVMTSALVGDSTWSQAGEELAQVRYVSSEKPARIPALPVFMLPVFEEFMQLGDAA